MDTNNCVNRIMGKGDPDSIRKFRDSVNDSNGKFSFSRIMPIPTVLKNIAHCMYIYHSTQVSIKSKVTFITLDDNGDINSERDLSPEELAALVETNARSTTEWCNQNWGSNGDATNVQECADGCEIRYSFVTPSSPPRGIITELRERFPSIHFCAFFDNEKEMEAGYY
jgi:hypothetical protein